MLWPQLFRRSPLGTPEASSSTAATDYQLNLIIGVLLDQDDGAPRDYRSMKRDSLQYHHPLSSAHSPRMPSVSASKSITYPQLPQQTLTTPLPSVRSCSSASKSALT